MTDVQKVRLLVGDPAGADQIFSDDDIQGLLDFNDGSIYYACASACDSMAAKTALNLNDITLGSISLREGTKATALRAQAEAFRKLEEETPAFAVVEENLSSMNEIEIIRNYILRTLE